MLKQINFIVYLLLFLANVIFAGKKLDKPYASKNTASERPIHANEITPNLPGLSETGKRIEEKLQDRLVKDDLHPRQVGEARVWELWHTKSSAEHQRNDRHISVLHLKNEIRQESQTIAGRVRLRLGGVKNLKEQNAKEKQQFRQTMRDVEHDTNIHKKARTIGEKDAHYINKPIWLDSKTLGYGSDGGSKGSSHGYRSKSASSGSSFEFLSRPKRRTHHSPSPKSSSSSSSIPSLSSTKFTNYSRTTSLNSDATNNPSPSSTATSKRKRQ